MKLLIIDTETTGLEEKVDQVIEVAGVLFDVELRDVICQLSFVLPCDDNAARHINKIAPEVTQASGTPLANAMMKSFYKMVAQADYLVAHNAAFDKKWFGEGPRAIPIRCTLDLQYGGHTLATQQQEGQAKCCEPCVGLWSSGLVSPQGAD